MGWWINPLNDIKAMSLDQKQQVAFILTLRNYMFDRTEEFQT